MSEYGPHCSLPSGQICGSKNCNGCHHATGQAKPTGEREELRNSWEKHLAEVADLKARLHTESQNRGNAVAAKEKAEAERDRDLAEMRRFQGVVISLTRAICDAATSLRTIANDAGTDRQFLESLSQIRGFANSRATVAEAAIKAALESASDSKPARFYVLSLKHTRRGDENLTWWRPDSKGYCWNLTHAGLYDEKEAMEIQSGSEFEGVRSNVAVPEIIARSLAHHVVEATDANLRKLGTSGEEWRKGKA